MKLVSTTRDWLHRFNIPVQSYNQSFGTSAVETDDFIVVGDLATVKANLIALHREFARSETENP